MHIDRDGGSTPRELPTWAQQWGYSWLILGFCGHCHSALPRVLELVGDGIHGKPSLSASRQDRMR
jgi:hypothetical protein